MKNLNAKIFFFKTIGALLVAFVSLSLEAGLVNALFGNKRKPLRRSNLNDQVQVSHPESSSFKVKDFKSLLYILSDQISDRGSVSFHDGKGNIIFAGTRMKTRGADALTPKGKQEILEFVRKSMIRKQLREFKEESRAQGRTLNPTVVQIKKGLLERSFDEQIDSVNIVIDALVDGKLLSLVEELKFIEPHEKSFYRSGSDVARDLRVVIEKAFPDSMDHSEEITIEQALSRISVASLDVAGPKILEGLSTVLLGVLKAQGITVKTPFELTESQARVMLEELATGPNAIRFHVTDLTERVTLKECLEKYDDSTDNLLLCITNFGGYIETKPGIMAIGKHLEQLNIEYMGMDLSSLIGASLRDFEKEEDLNGWNDMPVFLEHLTAHAAKSIEDNYEQMARKTASGSGNSISEEHIQENLSVLGGLRTGLLAYGLGSEGSTHVSTLLAGASPDSKDASRTTQLMGRRAQGLEDLPVKRTAQSLQFSKLRETLLDDQVAPHLKSALFRVFVGEQIFTPQASRAISSLLRISDNDALTGIDSIDKILNAYHSIFEGSGANSVTPLEGENMEEWNKRVLQKNPETGHSLLDTVQLKFTELTIESMWDVSSKICKNPFKTYERASEVSSEDKDCFYFKDMTYKDPLDSEKEKTHAFLFYRKSDGSTYSALGLNKRPEEVAFFGKQLTDMAQLLNSMRIAGNFEGADGPVLCEESAKQVLKNVLEYKKALVYSGLKDTSGISLRTRFLTNNWELPQDLAQLADVKEIHPDPLACSIVSAADSDGLDDALNHALFGVSKKLQLGLKETVSKKNIWRILSEEDGVKFLEHARQQLGRDDSKAQMNEFVKQVGFLAIGSPNSSAHLIENALKAYNEFDPEKAELKLASLENNRSISTLEADRARRGLRILRFIKSRVDKVNDPTSFFSGLIHCYHWVNLPLTSYFSVGAINLADHVASELPTEEKEKQLRQDIAGFYELFQDRLLRINQEYSKVGNLEKNLEEIHHHFSEAMSAFVQGRFETEHSSSELESFEKHILKVRELSDGIDSRWSEFSEYALDYVQKMKEEKGFIFVESASPERLRNVDGLEDAKMHNSLAQKYLSHKFLDFFKGFEEQTSKDVSFMSEAYFDFFMNLHQDYRHGELQRKAKTEEYVMRSGRKIRIHRAEIDPEKTLEFRQGTRTNNPKYSRYSEGKIYKPLEYKEEFRKEEAFRARVQPDMKAVFSEEQLARFSSLLTPVQKHVFSHLSNLSRGPAFADLKHYQLISVLIGRSHFDEKTSQLKNGSFPEPTPQKASAINPMKSMFDSMVEDVLLKTIEEWEQKNPERDFSDLLSVVGAGADSEKRLMQSQHYAEKALDFQLLGSNPRSSENLSKNAQKIAEASNFQLTFMNALSKFHERSKSNDEAVSLLDVFVEEGVLEEPSLDVSDVSLGYDTKENIHNILKLLSSFVYTPGESLDESTQLIMDYKNRMSSLISFWNEAREYFKSDEKSFQQVMSYMNYQCQQRGPQTEYFFHTPPWQEIGNQKNTLDNKEGFFNFLVRQSQRSPALAQDYDQDHQKDAL